jgi:Cupredoxin-like domain
MPLADNFSHWKSQHVFLAYAPEAHHVCRHRACFDRCRRRSPRAERARDSVELQGQEFDPAEISAPANAPIVIKLKNLDAKAMEFESKTLKVEKVVAGSSDATINVRAQKPGRYEFFDEYNEKVARGALVVK